MIYIINFLIFFQVIYFANQIVVSQKGNTTFYKL